MDAVATAGAPWWQADPTDVGADLRELQAIQVRLAPVAGLYKRRMQLYRELRRLGVSWEDIATASGSTVPAVRQAIIKDDRRQSGNPITRKR